MCNAPLPQETEAQELELSRVAEAVPSQAATAAAIVEVVGDSFAATEGKELPAEPAAAIYEAPMEELSPLEEVAIPAQEPQPEPTTEAPPEPEEAATEEEEYFPPPPPPGAVDLEDAGAPTPSQPEPTEEDLDLEQALEAVESEESEEAPAPPPPPGVVDLEEEATEQGDEEAEEEQPHDEWAIDKE